MTSKQEFIQKVNSLDPEALEGLFKELQADKETPLGMLIFVSNVYAEKTKINKPLKYQVRGLSK